MKLEEWKSWEQSTVVLEVDAYGTRIEWNGKQQEYYVVFWYGVKLKVDKEYHSVCDRIVNRALGNDN